MRSYRQICGGLLAATAVLVLAGCANDDSAAPVHARDLGTQKGETLVPYEPVVSRKITQDPSTFPMPDAPGPAEAPATAPGGEAATAAAPADEFVTLAKQVVESLVAGQYSRVTGSFDAKMKAALPEAQLQSTWEAVVAQAGPFKEQGSVRREQADGFEVAIVTCNMEKAAVDVKVAFSAGKEIAGLFITPAGAPNIAAAPASPEAQEMASQLMAELSGGQFDAIERRLSEQLKPKLPPGALQQQWTLASQQFGAYQSIVQSVGRKLTQEGQTFDYAEAILQFEKGTLVLVVAFDSQKQIVNLSINPGQPTPAAAPEAAPAETPAAPSPAQPAAGRSAPSGMGDLPPTAPAPIGLGN